MRNDLNIYKKALEVVPMPIIMVAPDDHILFMNQAVRHSIQKTGLDDIGINFIILPEFFDIPLTMMKNDRENVLAEFLL